MRKILVVAAHPDDEILGLGGTIHKCIKNGDIADCLILGEGITSRQGKREDTGLAMLDELKNNAQSAGKIIGYREIHFADLPDNKFDSMPLLEVIKRVEKHIDAFKPEIIYTHHYGDLNIDHRVTFEAVMTACRPVGGYFVKEIYCFETPSSTEWNFKYDGNMFKPNVFIDIQDTLEAKLKAIECYKSEIKEYPHPRSLKALEMIAARWGIIVGKNYVEAFELIRKVD